MRLETVNDALRKIAGISRFDAAVFLHLTMNGPATASAISSATGVNRMQVYRSLTVLQSRGMIELTIGRPRKYGPCRAEKVFADLVDEKRKETERIEKTLKSFADRLTNRDGGGPGPSARLRIIQKRGHIYSEIINIVSQAREEVLVFTTTKGIQRSYLAGVNRVLLDAIKRGINCRLIVDIGPANLALMRQVSRFVPVRHLDRQKARFIIVDRSSILAFLIQDEGSLTGKSETALWTTSEDFVRAHYEFFETAWNIAEAPERRLSTM